MSSQPVEFPSDFDLPSRGADAFMDRVGGMDRRVDGGPEVARKANLSAERAGAAKLAEELEALEQMSMGELVEKYREAFGVPTRTRNKSYLRKKIAWRIQELAEGGLSQRALARIEELAPLAPVRWRSPLPELMDAMALVATPKQSERDPRLPPPGTTIVRVHQGVEHRVTVLESSFEYQGQRFKSLSQIARLIAGTPWNGFLFFGLQRRARGEVRP